jgi:hypothetical protein
MRLTPLIEEEIARLEKVREKTKKKRKKFYITGRIDGLKYFLIYLR